MKFLDDILPDYPLNMQDPPLTAPDDPHSLAQPSIGFNYPARTVYRIHWTDAIWIPYFWISYFVYAMINIFSRMLPGAHLSTLNEAVGLSGLMACGVFAVCIALGGTSISHRIFAGITAVLAGFLSFSLSSWGFQALIGSLFLWLMLDQFILHCVDARATVPRTTNEQATIRDFLFNRWRISWRQPIHLWQTFLPLIIVLYMGVSIRESAQEQSKLGSYNTPLSWPMIAVLILLLAPFVVDVLAPLVGGRYHGPTLLISDFYHSLRSWFLYGRIRSANPALHRSPAGDVTARMLITLGVATTVIPLALPGYFYYLDLDLPGQERRFAAEREALRRHEKFGTPEMSNELREQLNQDATYSKDPHWENVKPGSGSNNLQMVFAGPQKTRAQRLQELQNESAERRTRIDDLTDDARLHSPSRGMSGRQINAIKELPEGFRIIIILMMPILLPVAVAFFATARMLAGMTARGYPLPYDLKFSSQNWKPMTDTLHQCEHGQFRHHVLWGINTVDNGPVIVPRDVLREHVHFLGDSGSGKTSLGISPLLAQLLQFRDVSVIVIDLKADDQTLFEVMRDGARQNSGDSGTASTDSADWTYPFRFFTPVDGRASHGFNLFAQKAFQNLSPLQKTDLLTTALGLQYGTDYGRKYFGDANFSLLQAAIKRSHRIPNFAGLANLLKDKASLGLMKKTIEDGSNVTTSVERLATIEALNRSPDIGSSGNHPGSLIDLGDFFEKPQAAYFALPAGTGSLMSAEMARMVLFGLMNAAQRAPKPRRQVYVIMDEFQRAVSGNIEVLLQMARSHDVSLILANQCLDDLRTPGADIASTVVNNTRIRQIFGVSTADDLRDMTFVSGERVLFPESIGTTVTQSEFTTVRSFASSLRSTPSTKLRVNDLIEASDHPNRSVFLLKRGMGVAQFQGYPFIMESCYHITPEEYERRRHLDWPEGLLSTDWKKRSATKPVVSVEPSPVPDESVPMDHDAIQRAAVDSVVGNDEEYDDSLDDESRINDTTINEASAEDTNLDASIDDSNSDAANASDEGIVWDGDQPVVPPSASGSGKAHGQPPVDPDALEKLLRALDNP